MATLRNEMLLREENYNQHFKNGGAGGKVLSVNAAMNAQVSQRRMFQSLGRLARLARGQNTWLSVSAGGRDGLDAEEKARLGLHHW